MYLTKLNYFIDRYLHTFLNDYFRKNLLIIHLKKIKINNYII